MLMSQTTAKCSRCKRRDPFFNRIYSGEHLCKRCFAESIEEKVRGTIAKYKMLDFNDRVAVAVSGGKDSISLLTVLAKMERKYPRATLVAVTVDEGIAGYRNEAIRIARLACKRLGIEHHIISFKQLYGFTMDEIVERIHKRGIELTPCAFCGVLRRRALNLAALEAKANKIATGHTLDDEVQTSLLNIFHGDLPKLSAEKPVTDPVHPRLVQKVKPFCEVPERESALYAYLRKIEFQGTPCPYAGEAMRNDIRTLINQMEERHSGTKYTVYRSFEKLRPVLAATTEKGEFRECEECWEPASGQLCMACQMLKKIR